MIGVGAGKERKRKKLNMHYEKDGVRSRTVQSSECEGSKKCFFKRSIRF